MSVLVSVAVWLSRILTGILVVLAVLPFIRSGYWVVRGADFPRVQILTVALLTAAFVGALAICCHSRRWEPAILLTLLAGVMVTELSFILPYTRAWTKEVPSASQRTARLVISNVQFDNPQRDEAIGVLRRLDADILVLVEVDAAWHAALVDLRGRYPHIVQDVRGEGLGLCLYSKFPLIGARIDHLVSERRPSIHTDVTLPSGGVLKMVSLHPTPPGLSTPDQDGRYGSRIRDAEVLLVAREVRDDPESAWMVAGDFNDVAWSHTTRLFKRMSGLKDPRIGRSLLNTYHSEYPLMRYPLDHVFVSTGFGVAALERIRLPGSDHFSVVFDFNVDEISAHVEPEASADDHEESAELVEEGVEESAEEGELPANGAGKP